jgi:trehalose transport system substrate-binding protein
LARSESEPPSTLFKAMGQRLADALNAYERSGGSDPIGDVVAAGEWGPCYRSDLSSRWGRRPGGRWELVFEQDGERMAVVAPVGGAWKLAEPRPRRAVADDVATRVADRLDNAVREVGEFGRELGRGLRGVPWRLWAGIGVVVIPIVVWLVSRDAPTTLRVLAGTSLLFVVVVVVSVVPRSMRTFYAKTPAVILYVALAFGITYVWVGAAEGVHVGFGWPVTAWLDLFENDTLLIDVLDTKRVEHHTHCSRYGCYEEDHFWISVGGEEWPVSQATHDVVREGEVVEIAYRPHTRFVRYVAYGPALSATRSSRELRVAVSLAPPERTVFEDQVLPEFKRRTGLDVTFVQMEPDALMEVLEHEGGSAFDLLAVDNNLIGTLADRDLVQDLSREEDQIPAETIPSMRPLTKVDGRTLFLPFRPNVRIAYYDTRTFEALGVGPPRTWDELLEVAARLEGHGGHLVLHGAPGAPSATELVEFIFQAGGDPLALDSTESRRALDFLFRLAPHLHTSTETAKFDTVNQYLTDGDAKLAPNWTFGVNELVVKRGMHHIAVYPGWSGPAGPAHVLGGDVLAIPNQSERRKPALKLATYLMSQPIQTTLANELSWPAMRTDAYRDLAPELRPYWDAITDAMDHAIARPAVPCWNQAEAVLSRIWRTVTVDHVNPATQIDRWANEIRAQCQPRASQQTPTTPAPQTAPTDEPLTPVERALCTKYGASPDENTIDEQCLAAIRGSQR